MDITLEWTKKNLQYHRPIGTSRGILADKPSWYLIARNVATRRIVALGECSPIPGLSVDNLENIENTLEEICKTHFLDVFDYDAHSLNEYPCLEFGLECLRHDLNHEKDGILFPSGFTEGSLTIPINGLIWMGNLDFMLEQIRSKLDLGYACIKLKIGSLDFSSECELLQSLRAQYGPEDLEIRVDANGAFDAGGALEKLITLSKFNLHSIEQPIQAGQWSEMAALCEKSPLPIALDEELIGVHDSVKVDLLDVIQPQFIILKPSLLGGFKKSEIWIEHAEEKGIGWWITSALESNVGLNAIAQWTATLNSTMPQGLGTGQIYSNNIYSPLQIVQDRLGFSTKEPWNYEMITTQIEK